MRYVLERSVHKSGNWYVLARNAEKGRIETFALSRFRGMEAAGSTFTRPADFDARQAFGITNGEKPIKVRLLFEPKRGSFKWASHEAGGWFC